MIYRVLVELPMNRKLVVPTIFNLEDWKRIFQKSSTRAKKLKYKKVFLNFYQLVKVAETYKAKHLTVKSFDHSIRFLFEFDEEESMITFTEFLSDANSFPI